MGIKWNRVFGVAIALPLAFGSVSMAFDDVNTGGKGNIIMELRDKGVLQGDGKSFHGERPLAFSEGVTMIVKGLGMDHNTAGLMQYGTSTDAFDRIADGAWYAGSFLALANSGVEIPRDVDPQQTMTREQFLHLLCQTLLKKGTYPFTLMYFEVADGDEIDPDIRGSVQMMLNRGFVKLDEEGQLHPKQPISREEAAVMLHAVMEFVDAMNELSEEGASEEMAEREEVVLSVEPLNDEAVKAILSRGEKPNSGYGIEIAAIVFRDGHTAEIQYRLLDPDPDSFYLQVITTPTAEVFLPIDYAIELKQVD